MLQTCQVAHTLVAVWKASREVATTDAQFCRLLRLQMLSGNIVCRSSSESDIARYTGCQSSRASHVERCNAEDPDASGFSGCQIRRAVSRVWGNMREPAERGWYRRTRCQAERLYEQLKSTASSLLRMPKLIGRLDSIVTSYLKTLKAGQFAEAGWQSGQLANAAED